MFKAVFFDLDGTLLPYDFADFLPRYFGLINQEIGPFFPDIDLTKLILISTQKMMQNNGQQTNQDIFWTDFVDRTGLSRNKLESVFDDFYEQSFPTLRAKIGQDKIAANLIQEIRQNKEIKLVLATNPVFPRRAITERIRWAGIDPSSFDLITSYENMMYCKPNPSYFQQIIDVLNIRTRDSLMVGNDEDLDLFPASSIGIATFLVTNDFLVRSEDSFTPDFEGCLAELNDILF